MPRKEFPVEPSTIEVIDAAFFDWIDQKMDVHTTTNKGWKKTPVLWVSSERSHQIKNSKEMRDSTGSLILPLITVERTAMVKDPARKGMFWGNIPANGDYKGGSIQVTRKLQQQKTSEFANADRKKSSVKQSNFPLKDGFGNKKENEKVVYQMISIPMPAYIEVTYSIMMMTEYQQQMNEAVTPFITRTGGINYFTIYKNSHQYPGFIQQDFSLDNNVASMEQEQRQYKTKIDVKILGYLIGEDKNQETPKVVVRENKVEVRMPRERVVLSDSPEHGDLTKTFYRS